MKKFIDLIIVIMFYSILSIPILSWFAFWAYKVWLKTWLCRSINFPNENKFDIDYVMAWTVEWEVHVATVKNNVVFDYSMHWRPLSLEKYTKIYPEMKKYNLTDIRIPQVQYINFIRFFWKTGIIK